MASFLLIMTAFKIVIGAKNGKCLQKELTEEESTKLIGNKIGDAVSGDAVGFTGYEFTITGGSDHCGFPMRRDIDGPIRKRIFAVKGVGLKKKGKGIKIRKTVCGNAIHAKTAQINLRVIKEGKEPLFAKETKKEEKKEEKKETPKEKPAEKKEEKVEKPKEIPKEEPKPEPKKEVPKEEKKPEVKEEKPETRSEKREEKPTEEAKKQPEKQA